MVEIAIALGVIAIALIAIMGVLPTGMHVQRDNRQDTIINSDGAYLLEAIRNSAQGLMDLTNYAEYVDLVPTTGMSGMEIVQRMSEPNGPHVNVFRSITGAAALRGANVPSFRYMVISEVRPAWNLNNVNPALAHYTNLVNNTFEVRLVFLWPLIPNSTNLALSPQKHVMRTLISGTWTNGMFNLSQFQP